MPHYTAFPCRNQPPCANFTKSQCALHSKHRTDANPADWGNPPYQRNPFPHSRNIVSPFKGRRFPLQGTSNPPSGDICCPGEGGEDGVGNLLGLFCAGEQEPRSNSNPTPHPFAEKRTCKLPFLSSHPKPTVKSSVIFPQTISTMGQRGLSDRLG